MDRSLLFWGLLCLDESEMESICRLVCWCIKRAYEPRSTGGGGDMDDMVAEYEADAFWDADIA